MSIEPRKDADERPHAPSFPGGAVRALSPDEQTVVQVLRLICLSYARPQSQAWEQALLTAQSGFGAGLGGEVTVTVMRLMRAIRAVRQTTFRFRDPACPCCRTSLSDQEGRVLAMVRAALADPVHPAVIDAMILCEGGPANRVLLEADRLAGLLHRRSQAHQRAA